MPKKKFILYNYMESSESSTDIKRLTELCEKISAENAKLRTNITEMRTDMDKMKSQLSDKISKAIIMELEGKINTHTKSIDATSKKLFEVQNNVNSFVQQPISHTLIDTIRKQLTEEILANTRSLIEYQTEKTHNLIDEKITETRNQINNAKRFMYR